MIKCKCHTWAHRSAALPAGTDAMYGTHRLISSTCHATLCWLKCKKKQEKVNPSCFNRINYVYIPCVRIVCRAVWMKGRCMELVYCCLPCERLDRFILFSKGAHIARRPEPRALLPTSAPPAHRYQPRTHTSPHPTGSHAPAPTSTPPDAHSQRRVYRCIHPMGSRAPAPTAISPGGRLQRRMHNGH